MVHSFSMSRVFSPEELACYNGVDKEQIYFSVRGKVYDVSDARTFYGPGMIWDRFSAPSSFDRMLLLLL